MKKFLLLIVFGLNLYDAIAQENKVEQNVQVDYLYGCENCEIVEFRIFQNYQMLIIKESGDKKLVLMNDENLWVDEIPLTGSEQIVMSPEKIYLRSYNYPAILNIVEDSIVFESIQFVDARLMQELGELFSPIMLENGILGVNWIYEKQKEVGFWIWKKEKNVNKTAAEYNFLSFNQMASLGIKIDQYTKQLQPRVDSVYTLLYDDYNLENVKLETVIPKEKAAKRNELYVGVFTEYAVNGKEVYLFDSESLKFFQLEKDGDKINLKSEFSLPYDVGEDYSWWYMFDSKQLKHYFLKVYPDAEFKWHIYEFVDNQLQMKKKIKYWPTDINDENVYMLIKDKNLNKIVVESL